MAVRSLNPLEQHAGKIFLGVALIICLLLVWHYFGGNPVKSGTLTVDEARQQLDQHNKALDDKLKPVKYDPKEGKLLRPDIEIPNAIKAASKLGDFDPDGVPDICRQILANTGTPQSGTGTSGPISPEGYIRLPVSRLAALPQPQVVADQKICGEVEISYVAVCASLLPEVWRAFVDDIQQQAKARNLQARVPPDLPLTFYRVSLQRRLVDANDQPIGDEEAVSEYRDPSLGAGVSQWEKDVPFPGLENVAKLGEFIAKWVGPPPTGWEPIVMRLVRSQNAIMHPLLPDAQQPVVDGYEPPAPPPEFGGDGAPPLPVARLDAPPPGPRPGDAAPAQPAGAATIYALDTAVRPASRYQYRIRYELLNPLLCQHVCKDEEHNYVPALPAVNWSPWSRTVQTSQDMYFWLLSESAGVPQFEVRRKVKGKWEKRSFPARIGQAVGEEKDGVDYRTGMIVVDIRRAVPTLIRSVDSDNKVMIQSIEDTQVVLRDANGRLLLRSMQRDIEESKLMKQ